MSFILYEDYNYSLCKVNFCSFKMCLGKVVIYLDTHVRFWGLFSNFFNKPV